MSAACVHRAAMCRAPPTHPSPAGRRRDPAPERGPMGVLPGVPAAMSRDCAESLDVGGGSGRRLRTAPSLRDVGGTRVQLPWGFRSSPPLPALATFRASILGRAASNLRVTRAVPSLLRGAVPRLDVMPWNRGPDLGAPSPDRPPGPIWGRPFMHLGHLCPSPTGTREHLPCCGPRASRAPCCRPGLRPQLPGLQPQLPGHL